MAARAIWKGTIRFGEARIGVKLYSAVEDRTIRFHLLHGEERVRVKQKMVNPRTGAEVEYGEARRGVEAERDLFVLLDPEELEELEPPPSRDIEVTRFLSPSVVNHQWYDRPYYLGPDGDAAAYFELAEALRRRGREGIARWTMRKKDYLGALREHEGYLVLMTLRHAEEVIFASELEPPTGRELDGRELEMAERFIGALEGDFDPYAYRDEYRDRVAKLVELKRSGGEIEPETHEEEERSVESLTELLEASLEAVG